MIAFLVQHWNTLPSGIVAGMTTLALGEFMLRRLGVGKYKPGCLAYLLFAILTAMAFFAGLAWVNFYNHVTEAIEERQKSKEHEVEI